MKSLRKAPLEATVLFSRSLILALFFAFAPIYFKSLNYSGMQIGLLMAIFPATSFLVTIPFGMYSDRIEPKRLVFIGFLFTFILFFGLTRSTDFWLVFLFFILGGIGTNLIVIPIHTLIYKTLKKNHKGRIMGGFAAIDHVAAALGILIGGYLITRTGFNIIFKIGIIAVIPLILLSRYLVDIKLFSFNLNAYEKDFFKKKVRTFTIILFLFAFHWGAESTSMALYLKENIGLIESGIGFFLAILILSLAFVEIILGFAFDSHINIRFLLIGSLIASGIGNVTLFFTNNIFLAFSARLLHVFGDAGMTIFAATAIANLFSKRRIGGDWGLIHFISTSGVIFGALLTGYVGARFGYGVPFLIAGLLSFLAVFIFLSSRVRFKR
ncbi:MFS transporter [Candidatus Woesearchaeota archaeon]|nr:MFS transporter [Candidatus Woesearchaeota archaeon]